ncbi:MAG: STAS domain-containing protein [Chloroflexota bacterium]
MEIKLEQINGVDVAVLIGEINGHTAPMVQEKLLPMVTADCRVLLDMRQVTYMSSAGLRILLLLYRQISAHEGRVVLTGLPEKIWDTMAVTGFLDFFEAHPSLEAGMAALQNNDVAESCTE